MFSLNSISFPSQIFADSAPRLSDLKGFSPSREDGLIDPGQTAVVGNGGLMQHDFFTDGIPKIIDFILQFSAGVAVLMIVVGGVMIMFAGEDEEYKSRGVKTLIWAIAGLIISVMAYVIVDIVSRLPTADGNPEVDLRIDEKNGVEKLASGNLLTEIIPEIIKIILKLVGTLALGLLMYAGALMVMRDDDDERISKARNIMLYAVIGIIVSVVAYLVVEAVLLMNFT